MQKIKACQFLIVHNFSMFWDDDLDHCVSSLERIWQEWNKMIKTLMSNEKWKSMITWQKSVIWPWLYTKSEKGSERGGCTHAQKKGPHKRGRVCVWLFYESVHKIKFSTMASFKLYLYFWVERPAFRGQGPRWIIWPKWAPPQTKTSVWRNTKVKCISFAKCKYRCSFLPQLTGPSLKMRYFLHKNVQTFLLVVWWGWS